LRTSNLAAKWQTFRGKVRNISIEFAHFQKLCSFEFLQLMRSRRRTIGESLLPCLRLAESDTHDAAASFPQTVSSAEQVLGVGYHYRDWHRDIHRVLV